MPGLSELAAQFHRSDPKLIKWSIHQLLAWKSAPDICCPVYQIHGDRDRVLPMKNTTPDKIVASGGHVISLTHPDEVNEFIRGVGESYFEEDAQ